MLTVLCAVVQGGKQGVRASLGGVPAVGVLCLRDGAHAVLADHSVLWPPQGLRLIMQAFSLRAKLCTARAIEWAEFCGPVAKASWVVATAERYAASPLSGPVCAKPKPLCCIGRVSWSVGGPSMRAYAMMAKAQSTALLLLLSILQTHKKSLCIQQHPASAFTAAIKNATWAGQAQAGKTPQAYY
jgi:hypothetical protein